MSVLVATPCYGNQCTAMYYRSVLNLVRAFERESYDYDILIGLNESLIDRARNNMACDFLDTDFQKLLFIDADIEFTPEGVSKLLEVDAPVVAGVYATKNPEKSFYGVWTKDGMIGRGEGVIEATYLGTGFMMIDRSVLVEMMEKYPELSNEDPVEKFGFFNRMKSNGIMLSEDYSFCQRVRDMGHRIYAHQDIGLIHHGMYPYGKA